MNDNLNETIFQNALIIIRCHGSSMTIHLLGQVFSKQTYFWYDNKAWSVKPDENTVTVQDYYPKISQQSWLSAINFTESMQYDFRKGGLLSNNVTF